VGGWGDSGRCRGGGVAVQWSLGVDDTLAVDVEMQFKVQGFPLIWYATCLAGCVLGRARGISSGGRATLIVWVWV
jgi:hypothetical protein